MRKSRVGLLGLIISAMLAQADAKTGGAHRADLFNSDPATCAEGATDTSGPTFGFVVLNTDSSGNLHVQVSLQDGVANGVYSIWVNQHPGDCDTIPTGILTTNRQGNGNAHVVEARVPQATAFWISARQEPFVPPQAQILRSVAVLLD